MRDYWKQHTKYKPGLTLSWNFTESHDTFFIQVLLMFVLENSHKNLY